jgi:hypothetical protein
MRNSMPAKLHAIRQESIYNMKRKSPSMLRMRLYFVLKNELRPDRLKNATYTSYYWRKCRLRLAILYKSKYQNKPPICPVYFELRLPIEAISFQKIEEWNRKFPVFKS